MWLFLLICEQKTKKWLKKSVYRHLKGEINDPKTPFSENLPFTLSKIKKLTLLWIVVQVRNTKATSTTWPIKKSLQRSLRGCSPSWQRPLLPGSSLLLNLSWGSRQKVPILAKHHATVERALGMMPGREQDALQMVLSKMCQYRAFWGILGDLATTQEQLPSVGAGTTTPGCSPPGKLRPRSLCGIPTIFWQKSQSCLGSYWYNNDRTAN